MMSEKMISKAKELLRHFQNFPVTLASIWLFTVILVFSPSDNVIWSRTLLFLFYYGTGSFLIETLFLKAPKNKWFFAALAADLLPASVFVALTAAESYLYWDSYVTQYSSFYFLILFLLALYFCRRKLGCPFTEYLVRVFGRTVRYHIVYLILMVGIGIIVSVVMDLFGFDYELLMRSQMLLLGLYYMSAFLLSFYPEKEESSLLTAALLKYVLSVMVIAAYAVIYVYILKILVTQEIPSNAIFRITAGLFAAAFPLCLMTSPWRSEHMLCRIMKYLPYLFLPFLLLQGYSIGVRLLENGVTPMRYAAVVFLLFECVALALYHFRPAALELLLPVGAGILCVAGFFPYINMNYVSFLNQKAVIDQYLSLTKEQQQAMLSEHNENRDAAARVRGAYSYLRFDYLGNQYMSSLPEESIAQLDRLADDTYSYGTHRISYGVSKYADQIDVSDYSSLYPVAVHEHVYDISSGELADYNESLSHYPLPDENSNIASIDLRELFDLYRAHADKNNNFDEYFAQHFTYQINDRYALCITLLSFTYDESQDTYYPFQLNGYLLVK